MSVVDTPKPISEYTQNEVAVDNETLSTGVEIIVQPISEMNSPVAQHVLADNSTSTLSISPSHRISSNFSRSHSETRRKFGMDACITMCGLFVALLILCIPITELVIGIKYQHQCPIQPKIPIYLIVAGSLTLPMLVLSSAMSIDSITRDFRERRLGFSLILGLVFLAILISLVMFAWFITGSVWIYSITNRVQYTNPIDPNYCDKLLYRFAYVITIINWVSLGLSCCQSCSIGCCGGD
ncbi:unnamed protein product [Adineta steineri]|uniref:Uncharacterized protein n=1 Tax=Adineta steineri TaxID=433720 RepID=A0A814HTF0_9BILA|nr:unnamed protein product [Adineta steineri]CAF3807324.1 unnamed protein product [Adineta steineri]